MQLPQYSTDVKAVLSLLMCKRQNCVLVILTSVNCLFIEVENPQRSKKPSWHKVLSKQRKRAVVACLRMAPLYNLPRCSHVV